MSVSGSQASETEALVREPGIEVAEMEGETAEHSLIFNAPDDRFVIEGEPRQLIGLGLQAYQRALRAWGGQTGAAEADAIIARAEQAGWI